MSIFGRKIIANLNKELEIANRRLSLLESENIQLNEKCDRYLCALNQANKENIKLNRDLSFFQELTGELEINNEELQKKITEQVTDAENNKPIILNELDECDCFRRKIIKDKTLAKSVYKKKWATTSSCETRLFELLREVSVSDSLKDYNLVILSQVRLADIIQVREDSLNDFYTNINYISDGKSKTNHSKLRLYEEMKKENFDDKKFKQTFLYPLLRSHVDFLICYPNNNNNVLSPLIAFELYGAEHFDLDGKHKKLQRNDEFKKFLFEAVEIGFDNSIKNETINTVFQSDDELNRLKSEIEGKILGCIRNNRDK